jgi:hypothetical protein
MQRITVRLAVALAALLPLAASAADPADLSAIRAEIDALKKSYESRLLDLEARLTAAEAAAAKAQPKPKPTQTEVVTAPAAPAVASAPASSGTSGGGTNAFNPAISLILSGGYTSTSQDPASYRIAGFVPSGDIGPGDRGFNLAETELGIYANIDPYFFGGLNLAIHPDNSLSVEEAFVQTVGLSGGATIKAGRFLSGIGYLNEQHAHVWDFVDAPLAYKAFLGGQFGEDGMQLRWLAPTDVYLELGAEIGSGRSFPGSDAGRNGIGTGSIFAHAGGDVGASNSWRAGLSYLQANPRDRSQTDTTVSGADSADAFSGTSRLWIADFVWKWAPNGNAAQRNLKLQAEYFRRSESGTLTYDIAGTNMPGDYRSNQWGGYAQAVYQFMPRWRTGLRYDLLDSGTVDYGANAAVLASPVTRPSRASWMLEYAPSEFSRFRLQLASDRARLGVTDNQVFVNYQMSLGAHGAHSY